MANIRFIDSNPAAAALEAGLTQSLNRDRAEYDLESRMRNQQVQEGVDAATRAGLRNVLARSSPEAPILSAAPRGATPAPAPNPEIGGRSQQQPVDQPPVGAPRPITPSAPMMTDRGGPGGQTVQRPDAAPAVPRIAGGRRDMTPVISELAKTPGGGQAALRVMQGDEASRERAQQRALQALARGDTESYKVLARDAGIELPPQIANDAGRSALFARGALEARRIYGQRGGRQSAAFVAAYMQNGGDAAAAFQSAGQAPASGGGRRQAAPRESVGTNRYKLARERAAEVARSQGREPTTQDTLDALREIGVASRKEGAGSGARPGAPSPSTAAPAPTSTPLKTPDGRPAYGTYNPATGGFDLLQQTVP